MRTSVNSTSGRRVRERRERSVRVVETARLHAALCAARVRAPSGSTRRRPPPRPQAAWSCPFSIGSSSENTVWPGRLSNSMMPPWRVAMSWATARPSPVPPGARGHQRIEDGLAELGRHARPVVLELQRGDHAVALRADRRVASARGCAASAGRCRRAPARHSARGSASPAPAGRGRGRAAAGSGRSRVRSRRPPALRRARAGRRGR